MPQAHKAIKTATSHGANARRAGFSVFDAFYSLSLEKSCSDRGDIGVAEKVIESGREWDNRKFRPPSWKPLKFIIQNILETETWIIYEWFFWRNRKLFRNGSSKTRKIPGKTSCYIYLVPIWICHFFFSKNQEFSAKLRKSGIESKVRKIPD